MGFRTSKADSDIWMRRNKDVYEYIAVYVDDLCIVAIEPKVIIDLLMEKYKYRLKGSGPIEFHLGCDYFRDSDGILCYAPKRYVEKMVGLYKEMFGVNPKEETSPLIKGDHPELDNSEENRNRRYQTIPIHDRSHAMGGVTWQARHHHRGYDHVGISCGPKARSPGPVQTHIRVPV